MSYLLRPVVPDRPGVLGAVATALGEAGIDIVSLDVLERTGEVRWMTSWSSSPPAGCPTP